MSSPAAPVTGTGNAEVDAKSAENVATLTSRDAATANGALVNTLTEKAQEIAACSSDSSCKTEREAYWDKVSQDRNAQIQDSCISGGMQACHMNITQMQVDLAELANSGTGRGLNQYTPEESNNIKQLIEKYRTNLERLASLGQAKESATLISPAMLAAKGYLTQQEAKDLQNLRAGTFIDVAGAVILPGGIKATGKNGANGEGKIAGEIKTPVTSGGTANSAAGIKLAEQLSNESLAASGANMNNIKVVAEGKINGQVYIDTNQTARPIAAANPSEITLTPVDRVATREAQGLGNVNGNMATAHAEIGVIQQASNAGVARGADMTLMVSGERVCGYCRGDIPASAEAAGLKPLTIVDKEAGLTYYWVPGMKNLKVR